MQDDIIGAYQRAASRLFLLDYDGTLADLKPTPEEAKPTAEILDTLTQLAADNKNTVVIISGRKHQELDAWLGQLPLAFAAEHGLLYKDLGHDWRYAQDIDTTWKSTIRPLMEIYTESLPGSFIEEKTNALVWHWRNAANQTLAEASGAELLAKLQPYGKQLGLRIMPGSCIVEVQAQGVDKGKAAKRWLAHKTWDFILAAGDDTTDEDLFAALPPHALAIKIGNGNSRARLRMAKPSTLRKLIGDIANQR